MNQDQPTAQSPFSALSYQEQQNRWLEWRSRQLDYRPAGPSADSRGENASPLPENRPVPRLRQPNMRIAAPVPHRELDEVLSRHRQAMRKAGTFQSTAID